MKTTKTSDINHRKSVTRAAVITVAVLLVPLVAMQFSDEMQWTAFDFAIIGCLLFGAGMVYEVVAGMVRTKRQRLVVGVVTLLVVLYLWAELAVGIFTNLGS